MKHGRSAPPAPSDAPIERQPTFREAARLWASIGWLSFGGPAGQIALMHRMIVEERRWVSEPRFLHALNFCMLLPGPEAQQLATYIGWLLHGVRGGIVAGILFILPGLVLILGLSVLYVSFQQAPWLDNLFYGLKAAVLVVIAEALIRIARRVLRTRLSVAIAGLSFVAIFVFRAPFPLIVLVAGLIGYVAARGAASSGAGDVRRNVPPGYLFRTGVIGGLLWGAPVLGAGILWGFESVFVEIGALFSWLALVAFGGAYAVLAYVAEAAVATFGWLSPGEMLDGLAMAEPTPGPLILVLSFVGFLAAFRFPAPLDPMLAGLVGGMMAAWVTFVPSFLWVLLGAPYVERLRHSRTLAAALAGVTAAVVGVILNLALWFALHVLFAEVGTIDLGVASVPWPVASSFDPWAFALMIVAALALFRFRFGVPLTLCLGMVLGVLVRLAGPG